MSEYFYARITKLGAENQNIQDMNILTTLKKSESRRINRKAVEEIEKPLKKIFLDFLEIRKPSNR